MAFDMLAQELEKCRENVEGAERATHLSRGSALGSKSGWSFLT